MSLHTLFPSIGDVIAAAFWLGLGIVTALTWRDHRRERRSIEHLDFPTPPSLPPAFRILPRPFDHERDL